MEEPLVGITVEKGDDDAASDIVEKSGEKVAGEGGGSDDGDEKKPDRALRVGSRAEVWWVSYRSLVTAKMEI